MIRLYSFENTLSFPSEETSLGRGGFPHIPKEMYHACPALLTVFSTTQSDHLTLFSRIHSSAILETPPGSVRYRPKGGKVVE